MTEHGEKSPAAVETDRLAFFIDNHGTTTLTRLETTEDREMPYFIYRSDGRTFRVTVTETDEPE